MSDIRDNRPDCGPAMTQPSTSGDKAERITTHHVEVKAFANGGSIDWEVDGKKPNESKLKFDRNSGPHKIEFDLDAEGGLRDRGLRFNCAFPIYVHANIDECPTSGLDEQIEVLECSTDSLTIYDKNSGEPKLLRYQLNFVETDGSKQVCDPIIDNGGGDDR